MSFDYSAAKAALKKAGHVVSSGPEVLATDVKEIVRFGRRMFGLKEGMIRRGIANPMLLPEGFPGTSAEPVAEAAPEVIQAVAEAPVPEAAPVTPEAAQEAPADTAEPEAKSAATESTQDTPVTEAATAEDAPKSKKAKKADAATDAPANGEQAA